MARILMSFIGRNPKPTRPEQSPSPRTGYVDATYGFSRNNGFQPGIEESSLFTAALLNRLRESGKPVDRWMVMGTLQSSWSALFEAVPRSLESKFRANFPNFWNFPESPNHIQAYLEEVSLNLTSVLIPTTCVLVGDGGDRNSQLKIWSAMADAVQENDCVVLDITHGLRHQPVLMGFMTTALFWLKGITAVEMYYGALEMTKSMDDVRISPVINLSLCQDVIRATEAIAIKRTTGNYAPLGKFLGLSAEDGLDEVIFKDEINRFPSEEIERLMRRLHRDGEKDALRESVRRELETALAWVKENGLLRRTLEKAKRELKMKQYQRAVCFTYEALTMALALLENPRLQESELRDFQIRRERRDPEKNLSSDERKFFRLVKHLRNAVVHGTDGHYPEVKRALKFQAEFEKGVQDGVSLAERLARRADVSARLPQSPTSP